MKRKEKSVVHSEIATKTSKSRYRPSSSRRIGKISARTICRVHRCFAVLRDHGSPEAALPQGRRLQTLGRPTSKQPHQRKSQRRGSCKDRITTMKFRPSQFGVRGNTASPRQHAPRLAVSHSQSQSNRVPQSLRGDESSPHVPGAISTCEPSLAEAANAATVGERKENGRLLSVHDVADLLQVPVSWVYGHTRDRCPDRIPGFRLGKYWRFDEADVLAWIQRRRLVMRRNPCIPEYNGVR